MKVCGHHLQRLEAVCLNTQCAYMCSFNTQCAYMCSFNTQCAHMCSFNTQCAYMCSFNTQCAYMCSFNTQCAYMCCGGHIHPSVCLSLLIYVRISPAFLLCRDTGLLCENTRFVCGDSGPLIQHAFARGAVFLKNECKKRPQTHTTGVISAVLGKVCGSMTGCG